MSVAEALGLGVVQGVTEFLPVSSSGHMSLLEMAFGMSDTSEMLALDVVMHAATLVVILVYFGRAWAARLVAEPRLIAHVALACIPAVVLYLVGGWAIEAAKVSLWGLAAAFMLAGGFLAFASRRAVRADQNGGALVAQGRRGLIDTIAVGVAQAAALFPGVSRSGMTIGAGLLRGRRREAAFEFSFMIGAPLMCGAVMVKAGDVAELARVEVAAVLVGFVAALVTGFVSLVALRRLVVAGRLWPFGVYAACVGLGCVGCAIGGGP